MSVGKRSDILNPRISFARNNPAYAEHSLENPELVLHIYVLIKSNQVPDSRDAIGGLIGIHLPGARCIHRLGFMIDSCTSQGRECNPALPVIIPEKRTTGSNYLCKEISHGQILDSKPDDTDIHKKATEGDPCKRRELKNIVPVRIMERQILVQEVADNYADTIGDRS
jgi:hypothetical protein